MNSIAIRDERWHLRALPGVRYGLKNGRGEYCAVCRCGTRRCVADVAMAARWFNSIMIDHVLTTIQHEDASWRVVRLLDHRWN